MRSIEDDTKGGFNSFLDDQKDEDGTAAVSLYNFNDLVERVYQGRAIENAPELTNETFTPGGRTALHDAIVTAIDETDDHLTETTDGEDEIAADGDDEPAADNVVVVVLTDGKENASETPSDTVRERVEEKRDDGWEFLFIGANQDAALTAEGLGMDSDNALNMDHDGVGTQAAMQSTSDSIARARTSGDTGGYTDEDRAQQDSDPRL